MPAPPAVLSIADLRARLAALPIDPVPLRRAGVLAALLVVLLVAGRALAPAPRMASERYETPAPAEEISAARASEARASETRTSAPRASAPSTASPRASAPRSGWTGGRVLALLLLAAGGAGALLLQRKGPGRRLQAGAIEVLGTHTLAPGQTLRLVSCGDDVLLLGASSEGIRLLRHWPRASFDREALAPSLASFADMLSAAAEPMEPAAPLAAFAPSPPETFASAEAPANIFATPRPLPPTEAPAPVALGVLFPAPAPRQFHLADA